MLGAGSVYLIGSNTRFLFPSWHETIQPLYLIPLAAELALALWLLIKGVDEGKWGGGTSPSTQ